MAASIGELTRARPAGNSPCGTPTPERPTKAERAHQRASQRTRQASVGFLCPLHGFRTGASAASRVVAQLRLQHRRGLRRV